MTTEYNAGSRVDISSHTAAFWEWIYAIDLRLADRCLKPEEDIEGD